MQPQSADPTPHRATLADLTARLPADQALGLRLVALARAAAAIHMAECVRPDLGTSQAAGLLRLTTQAGAAA